jgi:hypothetical protein
MFCAWRSPWAFAPEILKIADRQRCYNRVVSERCSLDAETMLGGDDGATDGPPTHLYAWYLLPLILAPLLLPVAAVLIVPTAWFAQHSGGSYLVTVAYGATLRDANCQVVIYGDSTAMLGIDPERVRQLTGLSTCNIAEYMGVTMLDGTGLVDQYLARNRRPRYLIFNYAPEDLNPDQQYGNTNIHLFEAITYTLRRRGRWANLLLRHPGEFFDWSCRGLRMVAESVATKPLSPEIQYLRNMTGGRIVPEDAHAISSCSYLSYASAPDKNWIEFLRSKYGRDGTTVLVDATPIPACDPNLSFFRGKLAGVVDNRVETLPVSDFLEGGRHTTRAGSVLLSERIASQIRTLENNPD